MVEPNSGPVFLSRPFLVPKKDTPVDRVVFDLSMLNKFVLAHRFWMVMLSQVRLHLSPGTWMASLELKDTYWHIPIHLRYQKLLAFQLEEWTLLFTVLPFGSSLAPGSSRSSFRFCCSVFQ